MGSSVSHAPSSNSHPVASLLARSTEWTSDPAAELVLSEIHIGKALSNASECTSTFTFLIPSPQPTLERPVKRTKPRLVLHTQSKDSGRALPLDADGDVIVKRRCSHQHDSDVRENSCKPAVRDNVWASVCHDIVIRHAMATTLEHVGQQVWRGAVLLSNFMLSRQQPVCGLSAVELGTGTGLAGIAAACTASNVLLTDQLAMLPLCQANVDANASLLSQIKTRAPMSAKTSASSNVEQCTQPISTSTDVLLLDWRDMPPLQGCPCLRTESTEDRPNASEAIEWARLHGWSVSQLCRLQHIQVVLAADCIYDDDLTSALMAAASVLLTSCECSEEEDAPVMYVALEKRWNFTLKDMDSRAAAYDHWRTLFIEGNVASLDIDSEAEHGRQLQGDLQGVQLYVSDLSNVHDEYGCDLELWQIARKRVT